MNDIHFFETKEKLWSFAREYGSTFPQDYKTGTLLGEHGQTVYYAEKR